MHQFQSLLVVHADGSTTETSYTDGFFNLVDGKNENNLRAIFFNLNDATKVGTP